MICVTYMSKMLWRPLHISQNGGSMVLFLNTLAGKRGRAIAITQRNSKVIDVAEFSSQKEKAKVMYSTCSRLELGVKRSEKYNNVVRDAFNKSFSTSHDLSNIFMDRPKCMSSLSNSREDSEEMKKSRSHLEPEYLHFHSSCRPETRASVMSNFKVARDYVSEEEEALLMKEVEPHLKRLKYEFDHWDDAIHGFRETERSRWSNATKNIICRMRQYAFPEEVQQLPQIHILDLAEKGVIKPHVDSVRFCGNIICGLSLLSDAVMRLVHVKDKDQVIDIILRRRSLYIMKDVTRYDYTHEVLGEDESYFGMEPVPRGRRVSIVCRNRPGKDDQL